MRLFSTLFLCGLAAMTLTTSTLGAPLPQAGALPPRLENHLLHVMERAQSAVAAPSLAVAIVRDGQTVWSGAVGHADVASGKPATASTLYTLGSISKVVTASTMMSLFEDGMFGLDEDINGSLAQPIHVPAAPAAPLTFRHLLTHTSGIMDGPAYGQALYSAGDFPISLELVVNNMLLPGGRLYGTGQNFTGTAPGATFEYSNVGYGLLGYLGERLTGMDFAQLSEARILQPLGMVESGWRLADIDTSKLATSYAPHRPGTPFQPIPFHGLGTYPDGSLRSSANELALFLAAQMSGGGGVLQPQTTALMQTPQVQATPEEFYGLGFEIIDLGGLTLVGHNGSDPGVEANMYFIPELGAGAVILTNTSIENTDPLIDLLFELIFAGASL